jgi:hypothetical protein
VSEKVVVQDVPSFEVIAGLKRTKITDIVAEFHAIDVQMKALKERRSELAEQGAEILTKAKVKSVMVGELRVTRMDGVSTSLSRVKLFELGVKETILEKATVRTPWTSLRVTEKGNGNGDR